MEQPNITPIKKRKVLMNNFIGGIAWGMGATVGVSIVLALFAAVANFLDPVPVVGDFISNVYDYVIENNEAVQKQFDNNE